MRRTGLPVVSIVIGLALWFGPWEATVDGSGVGGAGAAITVSCAAAPVDLVLYGNDPLGLNPRLGAGTGVVAPVASDACRTSAWWRTLLGAGSLGIGLGRLTRDRTRVRVAPA